MYAMKDEELKQRFEMLDQRLDNIDSIVTNLVERVMRDAVEKVLNSVLEKLST